MIEHVLHLILLLLAARSFGEIATRLGQPALEPGQGHMPVDARSSRVALPKRMMGGERDRLLTWVPMPGGCV